MPAQMPDSLIKQPDRTVESLEIGEVAYVSGAELRVLTNRDVFLKKTARIYATADVFTCLKVLRDHTGLHVTVLTDRKWTADAPENTGNWIPIESISVEILPSL